MDDLAKQLGLRVRVLREERGLSQYDLALMTGLNRSYLGDVELGKRNPSLKNIERIAGGLGVTVGKLFLDL